MSTDEQQKRGGFVPVGQVAARLPGALLHEYPVGVGSRVVGRLWP